MRLKTILTLFCWAVIFGFIYGIVAGLIHIQSNLYLSQKMYRLIIFSFVTSLNRGILIGVVIAAALIALTWGGIFFSKAILASLFELKITKKRKLAPLFKKILFVLIIAWALYIIVKSILISVEFSFVFQGFLVEVGLIFVYVLLSKIKFAQIKRYLALSSEGFVRKTAVALIALAATCNLLSLVQKSLVPPKHPNVLVILPDTLRPDHLGCYGYHRRTSPNIDKFAEECVLFEKAFSNSPWTKTAVGSILTSLYPYEHAAFQWADNLDHANLTLAEIFRNKNFKTFSAQGNHIITSRYGFHQGFQVYKEMKNDLAENLANEFISWVSKKNKRPFFAYLHFMDTHYPYRVPEDYQRAYASQKQSPLDLEELIAQDIRVLTEMGMPQSDRDYIVNLYDDSIIYFDIHFGRILEALKTNQMLDKTIIVLLSDHGEEFWEHGSFGHGHTLYSELLHVPLLIRYPSILPSQRIPYMISLIDLYPTVLSLAGIEYHQKIRGMNLLPAILNERKPERILYFEGLLRGSEKRGVCKDGWKLIQNAAERYNRTFFEPLGKLTKFKYPEIEKEYELYNILEDFREVNDLFNSRIDIFQETRQILQRFKINNLLMLGQKRYLHKKKLMDFKSLGYIE